MQLDSLLL